MIFNDTSNKEGLIQSCEWWGGFQDGDISGDTTLLKIFTGRINRRLEKYLGMLGAGSRLATIDDTNFTDQPFSTFNIVSGQHSYEFKEDEDGNAISDITAVLIKSTSGGQLVKLDKLTLDDKDAELIMGGDTGKSGTPTGFIERNNTIFFNITPNFSLTDGGKLFYKRSPSYFVYTDTTKEPGLPFQFHEMLAVGSVYDWVLIHQSNATTLITRIEAELNKWEKEFRVYVSLRNPQRGRLSIKQENNR
jgi:hypothetical protein